MNLRKSVGVAVAFIVVVTVAGCCGLFFRLLQTQALAQVRYASAHSEHAVTLNITADGWDTDNGASRVPIHVTGETVDGTTIDEIKFVATDGSGIRLTQGVYTFKAAGSPIAADGTVYQIPCTSATLILDDAFAMGETIDLAELAEQDSILTFHPIDAADMTNDEIYDAAVLAMTYKGSDAPDVAALCQAAINRGDAVSNTSGDLSRSCGEIGTV